MNLKRWIQQLLSHLSLNDLVIIAGLVLLQRGLAMVYEPAAWIGLGLILLVIGLVGSINAGRSG